MEMNVEAIGHDLRAIREKSPLVHNITNYVVMNSTANALLALGASPVMAHAEEEVAQMVELAGALVINIGTLSAPWIRAMHKAATRANALGVPIVLDPVGGGATPYRTETAYELLATYKPAILRGNASEIRALAQVDAQAADRTRTKGVDSTLHAEAAVDAALQLGATYGCTVCVSGATDYIVSASGNETSGAASNTQADLSASLIKIHNGHPLMAKITGMGCAASALCGAFAAVNPTAPVAAAHAMAVMGIAGELAARDGCGPGTMQVNFLDALYRLDEEQITQFLKQE